MKAALYVRTSTNDQTTENQERELRAVAARSVTRSWKSMQTMVFPAPRGGIGGQPLIVYAAT